MRTAAKETTQFHLQDKVVYLALIFMVLRG